MLSKPNINDLMEKAGTRYEVSIAIAKRAREIALDRLKSGDESIKDTVDLAATQIFKEKVLVKINGEYMLKKINSDEDMEQVISSAVDDILKDFANKDEKQDIEKPKKTRKPRKPKKESSDDVKEK